MSTRSSIKVMDKYGDSTLFYRHSDGYPSGNLPSLCQYMKWLQEEKIRDNVEQSAGWIILIGAREYDTYYQDGKDIKKSDITVPDNDWRYSAYEISPGIHGDIEYYYEVDIGKMEIRVYKVKSVNDNWIMKNKLIGTVHYFNNDEKAQKAFKILDEV